jgi:hypothetical protein
MWAFQLATSWTAYDRELYGDIRWSKGTLTEAKQQAHKEFTSFDGYAVEAVLP